MCRRTAITGLGQRAANDAVFVVADTARQWQRRFGSLECRTRRQGIKGKIGEFEVLDDGRFNVVLEGEARFRMVRELDVTTAFRQIEGELIAEELHPALSPVERASFEREARRFADAQGYSVDWDAVARLDDESLIDGVSQIAPFDSAAKQALLEADGLGTRCELLVQLMQFFGRRDSDDGRVTLQ